jgi:2-desacetyl-2-hydroxyethyl bacteriochlorophyllide A dehydrogenase
VNDIPAVMSAAVYKKPGVVEVENRPVPRPGPGQVLVEVDHCGICGSDIHMLLEGWGNNPGLIAGHEYSGTIAAVGEGVTRWQVGEEVVGGPSPKCGTCRRCLEGKPSQCENRQGSMAEHPDGAFARYILVREAALVRMPEGLSPREAALAEPLAVALHGITRSGVEKGDTVMVMGAGPIGALSVAALKAMGIGPITVVEPAEARRQLARDLGAEEVLDPAELEVFPMWEPERLSDHAVHAVLECSGKKAAMEAGFHQLRRGGILVLVGAGMEPPSFYDLGGFERALDLLSSGQMPNHLLIEPGEVTLDQISGALVDLATGKAAGKVMVVPRLSAEGAVR